MTSIRDLADGNAHAGSGGAWRSVTEDFTVDTRRSYKWRTIFHYETVMLAFALNDEGKWDGNTDNVVYNIGHGSVSDQNGMNKLFRHMNMPLYFVRQGGARIERTSS